MIRTIGALGAIFFALTILAFARDPDGRWAQSSPQERQWFREQKVPPGNGGSSGLSCCSEADGEEVMEDVRYEPDGKAYYWIKGGHFPVWTKVPDERVIKGPNLHQQPIVWWVGVGPYDIRCYAPGGGV